MLMTADIFLYAWAKCQEGRDSWCKDITSAFADCNMCFTCLILSKRYLILEVHYKNNSLSSDNNTLILWQT